MSRQPSQEDAIVDAALDLPCGEREGFLQKACGDDTRLFRLVQALVKAHQHPPIPSAPPASLQERATIAVPIGASEQPGDRIGRYKLLQQVGEGGCGVVYMAEQEEPVRRRVALKVIKLGMDTKQVIGRFEAERQALALMDHPNIAKVLDGGATDLGRPYFVMELVRGIKITDYCDQNNLTTEQRLQLFVPVCNAIQHAHQKGIIHRDIKPSNVLVTLHDGVPVPKVIDFGIAKATEQRLTDKTVFTALEQFMGTPAYMSPEQAEMSGLDIDTRSDIYSLGVLLYELLTGKTPLEPKALMKAGIEEMRRVIRESDPQRPSTRLSSLNAVEQTTLAQRRQIAAPKLIHLVRGDLDWIVMKALEKDRTRRYETANGLAADVQRHLQNEPVQARPPSQLYRLRKTVERNKLAFAAIGAIALALLGGLGVSTWMFLRERQERHRAVAAEEGARASEKKAQTEASKSGQVAQFLKDMLAGVGSSVAMGRDVTMLREILDKTAARVGKDLTNQPDVESELCLTLADTYAELGLYQKEEEMARQSLQAAQSSSGGESSNVALALLAVGGAQKHFANYPEAEKSDRDALAMTRKLLGNESAQAATCLRRLAETLEQEGKMAEAEPLDREALAMQRKLLGNQNQDVAMTLTDLGWLLDRQGRLAESEATQREALGMLSTILGDDHPLTVNSRDNLAMVLSRQHKPAEAESMLREVVASDRKLYGNDHPNLAAALNNLANVLMEEDKLTEAEPLLRQSMEMQRKRLGNDDPTVAICLDGLAVLLLRQGRLSEAEAAARESVAIHRKHFDDTHWRAVLGLRDLADILLAEHKYDDAERIFSEALTPAVESSPRAAGLLRERGNVRARAGHWPEALADFSKAAAFDPVNVDGCRALGPLLAQTGDLEGYRRHCARMVERFAGTNDPLTAARIAEGALMLPSSNSAFAAEGDWAETAVTAGKNLKSYLPFFYRVKSLAGYRQGHFADAIAWAEKTPDQQAKEPSRTYQDVERLMVLAMAQARSQQIDQARATLAKGIQLADTKMPKVESGDLGTAWYEWIIAHALMKEARDLIH